MVINMKFKKLLCIIFVFICCIGLINTRSYAVEEIDDLSEYSLDYIYNSKKKEKLTPKQIANVTVLMQRETEYKKALNKKFNILAIATATLVISVATIFGIILGNSVTVLISRIKLGEITTAIKMLIPVGTSIFVGLVYFSLRKNRGALSVLLIEFVSLIIPIILMYLIK